MSATKDSHLINNVIFREPGASDLFVDRFSNFVWSILARDLGLNRELAEDLHQSTFLRLFEDGCRRLRHWSGEGSFVNYLGTMVRNLANDHFRKMKVRGEVSLEPRDDGDDDPSVQVPASTAPGPEEVAAAAEQRRLLHEAIEELSERDRELVRRRHLKEQSYSEIAEEMDYNISSVGVILARAEKRLKKAVVRRLEECRLAPVKDNQ